MTTTVVNLPRITASALSAIVLAQTPNSSSFLAIIDVRDDGTFLWSFSSSSTAPVPYKLLICHTKGSSAIVRSVQLKRVTDHIGGHIIGSQHVPSSTLDSRIPELVRALKDKDMVVFHCALSQQRGPGAALRYLRERERLLGTTPGPNKSNSSKEGSESGSGEGGTGNTKAEEEMEGDDGKRAVNQQKVYVLDRGFVGWQERFGEDEKLTEGFRKELWKDGYWM